MTPNIPQKTGYLFDVVETDTGLVTWIIPPSGGKIFCTQDPSFKPSILVQGQKNNIRALLKTLSPISTSIHSENSLWHDLGRGEIPCTEISFLQASSFRYVMKHINQYTDPALSFYNIDIDLIQRYFYTRNLYPLCPVHLYEAEGPLPGYRIEKAP